MTWPPLHPMLRDRIEAERCPTCGTPGRKVRDLVAPNVIEEWACPECEPEVLG